MAVSFQDLFTGADGVRVGPPTPSHIPNLGAVGEYDGNSNGSPASALINANLIRCSVGDPHNDFHRIAVAKMTTPLTAVEYRFDVKPIQTTVKAILELLFRFNTNIVPITGTAAEYFSVYLIKSASPDTWQVYGSFGPWVGGRPATPLPGDSSTTGPGFSALLGTVTMTDGGAGLRFGATRFGATNRYDIWREPFGGGVRTFIGSYGFPNYIFDTQHNGVGMGFNGPGGVTTILDADNLEVENSTVGGGAPPSVGFRDTFTDPNATLLSAHTPDLPGTGTYILAAENPYEIQGNRAKLISTDVEQRFARYNTDITNGEGDGEMFVDVERITANGSGRRATVAARMNAAGTDWLGFSMVWGPDGFTGAGATQTAIVAHNSAGVFVTKALVSGMGVGGQLRFGMTLTGAFVEYWTEPYGGGARTIRGNHTFASSFQDATHRRLGIGTANGAEAGGHCFMDNLNSPGAGKVTPVGIASAEAIGTVQLSVSSFGTGCRELTKASTPVFTEVECVPP